MEPVPFMDLRRLHDPLRDDLDRAIRDVVERGDFIEGQALEAFESDFAGYCGTRFCVGVASGLDALSLTLQAIGVGRGDEVITAANTFVATVFAIQRIGATPVLVDCRDDTYCIDPDRLEGALSSRTRAILPVHLYGRLADMEPILRLASDRGVVVVEDAAQAHGAIRDGRKAGAFGRAGCFSFYPAKNLGAFGDGGAVTSDDEELADRLRAIRSYGQRKKNLHEFPGVNSRLDTLQAAILRVKLVHLDRWNRSRQDAARSYRERLAGLPLELPEDEPGAHVYHLFVVRVRNRDSVRKRLAEQGIQSGIHYPTPVHLQPACASIGYGPGAFPVCERMAGELLSLPFFPGIRDDEIDRVGDALTRILG